MTRGGGSQSGNQVDLDEEIRHDLRFVDDPAVDAFLIKIAGDAAIDPELIIQTLRVMRMRPPQLVHLRPSIDLFLSKSSRPSLRGEALYTVSYLAPVSPDEVRKVLTNATSDQNQQIAKQAEQLLARQSSAL